MRRTFTVTMTFNPENCCDVDPETYDPEPDLHSILEYGAEYFNLEDWQIETSEGDAQ